MRTLISNTPNAPRTILPPKIHIFIKMHVIKLSKSTYSVELLASTRKKVPKHRDVSPISEARGLDNFRFQYFVNILINILSDSMDSSTPNHSKSMKFNENTHYAEAISPKKCTKT